MQYMLLIYGDEAARFAPGRPDSYIAFMNGRLDHARIPTP